MLPEGMLQRAGVPGGLEEWSPLPFLVVWQKFKFYQGLMCPESLLFECCLFPSFTEEDSGTGWQAL